ncbi:DUF5753 domain-containing protein [Streptomyces oceani]|uniref:DUF5753 domain-containing protein n=1 Tax=Streptomyces oceani TaxID=1075402 RepID=UPI0023B9B048|nr:DUF5753 domain-containing protein [Streptomyces oceani]
MSLESDADRIISWSPLLVPGLLQTPGYARETISGTTTTRTPDEINALVEVRQARQAVLSRPGQPLDLWAVIHEAALRKRFAARPATMRDQLCRLSEICELPNVTLQLMPLNSTAHPGLLGSFLLATFPGPTPEAALLENVAGATYVEGEDTGPFASALARIRAAALSVEDTMVRIGQLAEGQGR